MGNPIDGTTWNNGRLYCSLSFFFFLAQFACTATLWLPVLLVMATVATRAQVLSH